MLRDEFVKADRDARQARGHGVARGNFNGSADNAHQPIIVAAIGEQVYYAVSGVFRAAVDAEDAHGGSVAGQLSVASTQFLSRQQHLGLSDFACSFSSRKIA